MNIGILLLSTWKYNRFIDNTISGIRKYLFNNSNIKIYLHTDSEDKHDCDSKIYLEHQRWPLITLKRFHTFNSNSLTYESDFLFYLDIDVLIRDHIDESIVNNKMSVVYHSVYYMDRGTPENNPASTAYIDDDTKFNYVSGGFFGGPKDQFLKMSNKIASNIDIDLKQKIIAKWHDESHLNRYAIDNKESFNFLDPMYLTFGDNKPSNRYTKYHGSNTEYNAKIIALYNSQKGFDKHKAQ